jgi:glutathione S-transferase
MLKFYYNPISINARRVWVALLEKQIPFEPILVNLDDDRFHDDSSDRIMEMSNLYKLRL